MLTVDLLPEAYRKASQTSFEQFHRTPLAWLLLTLLVMGMLVPLTLWSLRSRTLAQLNAKIQERRPKHEAIEQVQRLLHRLQEQETAFKGLMHEGGNWSRRLNTLSDVTPDGVWFTELMLERGKGLMIQGAAVGEGGAEMMRVGRLVQDLKANTDFSKVVKDIQIESIKREQDKEIEIVKFTLTCSLKEGAATP
jgi:Tfp pilus assembly protein PilN